MPRHPLSPDHRNARAHGAGRFAVTALVAVATLVLGACGDRGATDASDDRPLVVCTTAMVGDLARAIAGDDARVITMFGATVDPHQFRPTRDDVATLTSADLVIVNGFHLEGYMTPALERVADGDTRVIALAERIASADDRLPGDEEGAIDPHLWMDVELWGRGVAVIEGALARLAPEAAGGFSERADELEGELEELDERVANALATIPKSARVLVTAHDAFRYFGRRYDIEVEAIQGVSTASEAGMHDVATLVDLLVTREIRAVFFESTVSDRNVRALVEGARARGHDVAIGGELHSDAPGDAATYIGMIEHNARTITDALGGESTVFDSGGAEGALGGGRAER